MADEIETAEQEDRTEARHLNRELGKALYFFERSNPPETVDAEGSWATAKDAYSKRARRLLAILNKRGFTVTPPAIEEAADSTSSEAKEPAAAD